MKDERRKVNCELRNGEGEKKVACTAESPARTVKTPEKLVIVNPDEPSYDTLHLCIYMRELMDEAEKTLEAAKVEKGEK